MALYLSMDGVDDYIKLPSMMLNKIVADVKVRRRTDAARFIWDFRTGISFSSLNQTTGGVDTYGSGTVKVNGSTVSGNTAFIPNNTKCTIEHTFSSTGTDDGNIFSNNGVSANTFLGGDIFDIKLYNGATLVAHYDMTTGTVQDQSGNGRHATLTGGTWLDDGTGGTGTDGSTAFDIRPSIYSDSAVNVDTKQSLYADLSLNTDMRNVLYRDSLTDFDALAQLYQDSSFNADTKQAIYSDSASGQDTKLSFYQDGSALYDTLQELFSDGIVGSTPFDLRLVLYADANDKADTAQRYYTDGFADFDTLQAILEDWAQYREVIQIVLNISQKQTLNLAVIQRDNYTLDITQRKEIDLDI